MREKVTTSAAFGLFCSSLVQHIRQQSFKKSTNILMYKQ